jgi:flagellin-like hook-associated protein FlgL
MNELYREYATVFEEIENNFNLKKLPKLKLVYKGALTNILNLTDLLVRKAIIKENLYTYEENCEAGSFCLPDQSKIEDSKKAVTIYDRIKGLQKALEFQITTLPDSVDRMDEMFLEHNRQILKFISFHTYNNSNVSQTTLVMQEMTDRIISGKDQIFSKIVVDNLKLLADNYKTLNSINEELIMLKKIEYMSKLRLDIFPELPGEFTEELFNENPTHYLEQVKAFMKDKLPDQRFHPNWTREAIKDFYINDDRQFLERVKPLFLTERETRKAEALVHSPREKLVIIIRHIAKASNNLDKIYHSMSENIRLLQEHKKKFLESIVNLLNRLFNSSAGGDEEFFHIEYINPSTRKVEQDTIKISDFMINMKKKINLFNELLNDNSSVFNKINNATEESLYKFMEDTYFQLMLMKERITGINIELRLSLPRKSREQLKDITRPLEELTDLLTQITNQRRKYVAEQDTFGATQKK